MRPRLTRYAAGRNSNGGLNHGRKESFVERQIAIDFCELLPEARLSVKNRTFAELGVETRNLLLCSATTAVHCLRCLSFEIEELDGKGVNTIHCEIHSRRKVLRYLLLGVFRKNCSIFNSSNLSARVV